MTLRLFKTTIRKLLFSLILISFQSQAQEISLDHIISIFYQRNIDLIAARYNINQSFAESIVASAIPNPTVTFQIGELSNTNLNKGASATGCNHNINVSCGPSEYYTFNQLIEIAGKRGAFASNFY